MLGIGSVWAAPPPEKPVPLALAKAICGERWKACAAHDAGRDATGRSLVVLKHTEGCVDDELVVLRDGTEQGRVRLGSTASEDCGGGLRASEDTAVGPNRWTWSSYATTTFQSIAHQTTVQLSPLAVVSEFHAFGTNPLSRGGQDEAQDDAEHRFDFRALSGTWRQAWECDDPGSPEGIDSHEVTGVFVPRVTVQGASWPVPLGTCAVHRDASMADAVTWGKPGTGADGALAAVMVSPTELWVEVDDDIPISGQTTWILDDHVEIWVPITPGEGCSDQSARQWAVRLSDGAVFAGQGAADKPPVATRAEVGGSVLLRVVFVEAPPALTVLFSDSDDGVRQERFVSTSRVLPGIARSISPIRDVSAVGHCVVEEGALTWKHTQELAVEPGESVVSVVDALVRPR